MSWKRWLIAAASFAAAIGVSAYLVWNSWREAGSIAMLPVSGHLLAAGAMALELLARTLKFQLVASAMKLPLSFGIAMRTCLAGDFAAGITPSRTGGEPARGLVLSETNMGTTNIVFVLFAELFLEMATLLVVALLCGVFFRGAGAIIGGVITIAGGYAALVLGMGAVGYALARRNATGPVPRWALTVGLHAGHWRAVQRVLRRLRAGITGMRLAARGALVGAAIVSVAHIALRLAVLPLLLFSFGVRAPLAPLVLWPMALIFGGNAVPAPGGGGLVETGFKIALGGVIEPLYFAATLIWWRFYTFYALVLLGSVVAGRAVLRALNPDGRGDQRTETVPA